MKTLAGSWIALAGLSLLLAGCGGGGGDSNAKLRILHASPDAPAVDVTARGATLVANAPFKAGTGFIDLANGPADLKVNVAGTATTVIAANPFLLGGRSYTLVAANKVASIEPLLIEEPDGDPPAGQVRLRVLHAAPAAPAVDVYVTGPDAALATPTLANVPFKAVSAALDVPAGNYRVRVTAAGVANPLYDSGPVALAAGQSLLLAAVEQNVGASPITLVGLTGDAPPTIEIADRRGQVRVVHASPDAPAVDVLVDGAAVLSSVPFNAVSSYLTLDAGTYNVKVNAAGTATTVIDAPVPVAASKAISVIATGFLATIAPWVLDDDLAPPPPGQAKLRVVHASPDAPAVDVFANGNRVVANLAFRNATAYLVVPAGAYAIEVRIANAATAVLAANVDLAAGSVSSAFALGSVAGTGAPLQLKLATDR